MLLGKRFETFVEKSPASVMVQAILERAFSAEHLDALFERAAERQYTRELAFSTLVQLMNEVVLGVSPSVHAAYQDTDEEISVSIRSVYNKLNGVETAVSAELVRDSGVQLGGIVRKMRGTTSPLLPDYRVRILDGNHLSGTEHRIGELRTMRAAALPGHALVVFDPELMLATDVVLCEDGHAQERSLLDQVVPMVQPGDLWMADRNFCTTGFVFAIARQSGSFLIRQHASTLHWELQGKRKRQGRTATGVVYEQAIRLRNPATDELMTVRRITLELDEPTRDGETEIHLLTNVSSRDAGAKHLATLYAKRWSIETMFQHLTLALRCEINTLGYPKAALFGFCLALLAYNAVSVVKASLRTVHGERCVAEEVSWYYICTHLAKVHSGMMIAIPSKHWRAVHRLTDGEFVKMLRYLAERIDLKRFRKHPRGPKRPPPKKTSGAKIKHVSTARILAKRQ